jgi:uncharacterized membrane protein
MSNYDTFILYAAEYSNLADAEADYDAVKDLYYELGLVDTFDAAVIEKQDDGKVKIVKKHEQPTRKGGWVGAGLGLAAGATLLLFPAAAIGAGVLVGTTGGGAALGALAGHVARGISRHDLKEVGESLDTGDAGLIVVAAVDVEKRIDEVIKRANKIVQKQIKADRKELEAELKEAEKESDS